jgi:hypothetical protein
MSWSQRAMPCKKSWTDDDESEPDHPTVLDGFRNDESLQSPGAFLENLVERSRRGMFEQDYVESEVDFNVV